MAAEHIFRKATFGGFDRRDVIEYIEELKLTEEKLTLKITEKDDKIASLEETAASLEEELAAAKDELSSLKEGEAEREEALRQEYLETIESLKKELEESRSESQTKGVEEKIGSAMLDVRRYADLLVSEACEKIDTMSDNADMAASKALSRVLDITSGIQTFSQQLNRILGDIIDENDNICKELIGFKGSVKVPFEQAAEKLHGEILGE